MTKYLRIVSQSRLHVCYQTIKEGFPFVLLSPLPSPIVISLAILLKFRFVFLQLLGQMNFNDLLQVVGYNQVLMALIIVVGWEKESGNDPSAGEIQRYFEGFVQRELPFCSYLLWESGRDIHLERESKHARRKMSEIVIPKKQQ